MARMARRMVAAAACLVLGGVSVGLWGGCSINDILSDSLSEALSGGGGGGGAHPLLSENDPELVREALPFTLKLLDILIGANVDSPAIRLVAAQAYAAYAVLFLQSEANTVARDDIDRRTRMLNRSKIHLLRARDYALSVLQERHPDFRAALDEGDFERAFADVRAEDVPYLYYGAAGWIGAATVDVFDFELSFSIPRAAEMIHKAYELEPDYGGGMLHEFYIAYFGALPEALGGDKERAAYHYRQAVEVSDGLSAPAHVAMALSVAVPAQDAARFRALLEEALAVDAEQDENRRLTNTISQRDARWYLDNIDRFFVDISDGDGIDAPDGETIDIPDGETPDGR